MSLFELSDRELFQLEILPKFLPFWGCKQTDLAKIFSLDLNIFNTFFSVKCPENWHFAKMLNFSEKLENKWVMSFKLPKLWVVSYRFQFRNWVKNCRFENINCKSIEFLKWWFSKYWCWKCHFEHKKVLKLTFSKAHCEAIKVIKRHPLFFKSTEFLVIFSRNINNFWHL